MGDEVQLRLTIVPMAAPAEATLSQAAAVDEPFAGRHDSLMQLLLRIACVQPGIVKLLLEKVRVRVGFRRGLHRVHSTSPRTFRV